MILYTILCDGCHFELKYMVHIHEYNALSKMKDHVISENWKMIHGDENGKRAEHFCPSCGRDIK